MDARTPPPPPSGLLDGSLHLFAVRVYYEDTDLSGIVYHANYLRFMERGRTNHLRLMGASQHALFEQALEETPGFAFVVRSMELDFLRPARMDDVLDVVTWPVAVKGASITLAQWAVESAWGAAMPPDSNNPFGIKAVGDQPAVESLTREVVAGETITIRAKFRKFASLSEAFDLHGRLLATAPVYRPAMRNKDDPDAFADALTGVYATDPAYGTTLKYVIKTYNFTLHDK